MSKLADELCAEVRAQCEAAERFKGLWMQANDELERLKAGPVAYFDNAGKLQGRVSDEQLLALCRTAIADIQKRNGWACEDEGCPHYGTPHVHTTQTEVLSTDCGVAGLLPYPRSVGD